MEQGRIARKFKHLRNEGRTGVIPYITVGYPDMDATEMLVPALAGAGADLIELGVPFSGPLGRRNYDSGNQSPRPRTGSDPVRLHPAGGPAQKQSPRYASDIHGDTITRSSAMGWPDSDWTPAALDSMESSSQTSHPTKPGRCSRSASLTALTSSIYLPPPAPARASRWPAGPRRDLSTALV